MAWRAGLLVASLSDDSLASSVRVDSFVRARELQGSHRGQGHVAQLVRGAGKVLSPRERGGMGTGGATRQASLSSPARNLGGGWRTKGKAKETLVPPQILLAPPSSESRWENPQTHPMGATSGCSPHQVEGDTFYCGPAQRQGVERAARCALHPPLPPPASQSEMAPALPLPRLRDLPNPDLLPPVRGRGGLGEA